MLFRLRQFLWNCFKLFFRLLTGKCELQRICDNYSLNISNKCVQLETAMNQSKCKYVKDMLHFCRYNDNHHKINSNINTQVDLIIKQKRIKITPELFRNRFTKYLTLIHQYNDLLHSVKQLHVPYNKDNNQHEESLLQLWDYLMPEEKLTARKSLQWTFLGFQGSDPSTDFRSMGYLALVQLLHFTTASTEMAISVLLKSQAPATEYPFALVGIQTTKYLLDLLISRKLAFQMYSLAEHQSSDNAFDIVSYHNIYIYIMIEFDKYWRRDKYTDIMQFNPKWAQFELRMTQQLISTPLELNSSIKRYYSDTFKS